MSELFLKIVNMSASASWLILAVLGLRLVLKKAPKWVNVLLWGIVAVRLLFPFSIESALSLIPSAETIPEAVLSGSSFEIPTGIVPADGSIDNYLGDHYLEGVAIPSNNTWNTMYILSLVWLMGMLLLAAYAVVSYWRLRRKVDTAVLLRENIFQSESIIFPFVLGIIKPRIYTPFKMDGQNLEYVVSHEMAHIRRKDHWWKPLGFLLLILHWFNPLVWISYVLLCRDIELACDEKVIKELDDEGRANYTQTLVACSMNHRMITACPVAFGEIGVKKRVKSIVNYKKPAPWVSILAVIFCVVVAVCFLTSPVKAAESLDLDKPNVENHHEEVTQLPFDADEDNSNKQDNIDKIESNADVPREDTTHTQEEFELLLKQERESLEVKLLVLKTEVERLMTEIETEKDEKRRASLEETIRVLEQEIARAETVYEAMVEEERSN